MFIKKLKFSFSLRSVGSVSTSLSRRRGLLLLVFFFLIASVSLEAQCAMCRAALESEADNSQAEGVNNGIVYLMAIPYLLVGGLFYLIYRKIRG